jgi:hypothetical protein
VRIFQYSSFSASDEAAIWRVCWNEDFQQAGHLYLLAKVQFDNFGNNAPPYASHSTVAFPTRFSELLPRNGKSNEHVASFGGFLLIWSVRFTIGRALVIGMK